MKSRRGVTSATEWVILPVSARKNRRGATNATNLDTLPRTAPTVKNQVCVSVCVCVCM